MQDDSRADIIFETLVRVLREHVQYEGSLSRTSKLRDDLGLDSLQQLTFVVEVENAFAMCFAPGAEDELETLDDVVRYVQTAQAESAMPAPDASATL